VRKFNPTVYAKHKGLSGCAVFVVWRWHNLDKSLSDGFKTFRLKLKMYEHCAKRLKNMLDLAMFGTVNTVPWLSKAYG